MAASSIPDKMLPNVWGEGVLFAFSGLDGKTDMGNELVATTLQDEPGFLVRFPVEVSFLPRFFVEGQPVLNLLATAEYRLVCGDAIDMRLRPAADTAVRLRYVALNNTTFAGALSCGDLPCEIALELIVSPVEKSEAIRAAFVGEGDAVRRTFDRQFEAVFIISSEVERIPRFDFDREFARREAFFTALPMPKRTDEKLTRALMKCFSVLKVNTQSAQRDLTRGWATPDRYPHRYMWLWDAAFQALGLKYISMQAAEETVRAALAKQRRDGFIPHMMTPVDDDDSRITQPPLLCWTAWRLFNAGSSRQFLETVFSQLVKYVKRFLKMDRNGNGLLEWSDGGFESGMDNSPRFDAVKQPDAVDLNAFVANELFHLEKIAMQLDESDTAEECRKERDALAVRINELLWNEEDGIYYDLDAEGRHVRVKTEASFMPMFAGIVPAQRLERLVAHVMNPLEFNRPLPVSSVAADEPTYCDDMWRGPVWANYNYLIIEGVRRYRLAAEAEHIARRTVEEISRWYHEEGVIFEFFDSEASASPRRLHRKGKVGGAWLHTCVKDYGWTAAVFAELLCGE